MEMAPLPLLGSAAVPSLAAVQPEWFIAAATPLVLALLGMAIGGRLRRNALQQTVRTRLEAVERALSHLDQGVAVTYEIDDRYGRGAAATDAEQAALLDLRKDLCAHMAHARAAIDAFGDLRDLRLSGEAFYSATRPVYVNPPMSGDNERSLDQLRGMCTRMRGDLVELVAHLRSRLDQAAWRDPFPGRR
jgi:hypothetical protein